MGLQLNKYLKERKETLQFKVSANERSFEIWGREKFLSKGQGRRILKRCGLEMSFFKSMKRRSHLLIIPAQEMCRKIFDIRE